MNEHINTILNRYSIENKIVHFLDYFEQHKENELIQRCIYLYGPSGIGKTTFVLHVLKSLNYDVILYDAGDIRNKDIVNTMNISNMSNMNVVSLFSKKNKKIAIVMDEIDCMNNGDKGGINSLIKLIRPKKTKRQKVENTTHIPILCIGNNYIDKKVKELMKCCLLIEFPKPSSLQIQEILRSILPQHESLYTCIHGNLKKLMNIHKLIQHDFKGSIPILFEHQSIHEDSKQITQRFLNSTISLQEHYLINDTDRTIVSLLWHENCIDLLEKMDTREAIHLYQTILDNICFADYIDRITFQYQIWRFNEMSSIIKTLYTNYLFQQKYQKKYKLSDIRFTKVLTKYSTQYNNDVFIQGLCRELNLDKKDMITYMLYLKSIHTEVEIISILEHTNITSLDVHRFYRYINKTIDEPI
jgi:DNA polymerase III delta prime subunit